MPIAEDVADLVAGYADLFSPPLRSDNLFGPGRLEGDDADKFLDEFSARFDVDLTDFRDYLHFDGDEPPIRRRTWGETPDGARLDYIPIGLFDLVAAAQPKRWTMPYPPHNLKQASFARLAVNWACKAPPLAAAGVVLAEAIRKLGS